MIALVRSCAEHREAAVLDRGHRPPSQKAECAERAELSGRGDGDRFEPSFRARGERVGFRFPTRGPIYRTKEAIHHHGSMLLSTVEASLVLATSTGCSRRPSKVGDALFCMRVRSTERLRAASGGVRGSRACRISRSIRLRSRSRSLCGAASSRRPGRTGVKRIPVLKQNENAAATALAQRLALASTLDLKLVRDFDFYPTSGG